jgi:hypothetical protein
MAKVNWVKDAEYLEPQSEVLNIYFAQLWNSNTASIHLYDPGISDDESDGYLRVLDDSPEEDWVEFLRFQTFTENHKGLRKKQADGATLIVIYETYREYSSGGLFSNPGPGELHPLYLLVKD